MPVLKTILFTLVAPTTATILVPYLLLTKLKGFPSIDLGPFKYIGLIPIILGAIFYLWSAWHFAFTGRGTPAPIDPPKIVVTRGLYRHVRNPMYMGIVSIILGEFILFGFLALLILALLMWIVFHTFVILYEEPHLKKTFGAGYEEFRNSIPRWIPRLTSRKKN